MNLNRQLNPQPVSPPALPPQTPKVPQAAAPKVSAGALPTGQAPAVLPVFSADQGPQAPRSVSKTPLQLNFIEPHSSPALSRLNADLKASLSLTSLPAEHQAQLHSQLRNLEHSLKGADPQTQQEALEQLRYSLQQQGLLSGRLRQSTEAIAVQIVQQSARQQGQPLEPVYQGGNLIALRGPSGPNLDKAQSWVQRLRQQDKLPAQLNQQTLLLMSLRDELLRRQMDLLQPRPAQPPVHQGTASDLAVVGNAIQMVDQAMASSQNLNPRMLADLQEAVQQISTARPGEALQELKLNRLKLNAPEAPDLSHASPQAPVLNGLPAQPQLPADINRIAQDLVKLAQEPAPNFQQRFGEVMGQYTEVMDTVQGALPRLYFPVTLPIPLVYNDGNTAFVMPPGSRLSQDRRTGDYNVQMPGFLVLTDGTRVTSENIRLNLGPTMDGLQAGQINVTQGQTHTQLQGVTAAISRSNQSATIAAERVQIDDATGQFLLTNAQITQNTQGFTGSFDSLQMPDGQSLGATSLRQYNLGDTAFLEGQTQQLNLNNNDQQINAETLALQLQQGPNGQQLLMQGTGVRFQEGEHLVQAAQAQINVLNNADGSGLIQLAGQDLSWQQGSQQIQSPGQSQIALTRNAGGWIEGLNIQSEQINYTDGERLGQVSGGSFQLTLGPEGQLQQAQAQASQFNWQDASQTLNASQTQLGLAYDEAGNLSLNGQVGSLDYNSADQQLKLLNGQLQAQTEGDRLSSLNAKVEQLNWQQGSQSLAGQQLELDLNTHANGSLAQALVKTGQLNYLNGAEQLQINGSQTQLNFGENGLLQQGQMQLGELQYSGEIGKINTTGQTLINGHFHENGQLASLDVQTQGFSYISEVMQASAANAQLQLTSNAAGQLQQLHAAAGDLNVSGDWGQLQTQGQTTLDLQYANNQLQAVKASSEQLNFVQGSDQLSLTGAQLEMQYTNGQLTQALGSINSGSFQGDFGQADLTQGQVQLGFANEQLQSIQAGAEQLKLQGEQGQLDLKGAQLNAQFGDSGQLSQLQFNGESVKFNGQAGGKPLELGLEQFQLDVNQAADGSQSLVFAGKNFALAQADKQLQLENIRDLSLQTRPDGSIDRLNLHLDGHNSYSDSQLTASLDNFQAQYQQEGNQIDLSFDKGQLQTQDLNIEATGGKLHHDDHQISLHLDSASVKQSLEQELNVKVERVDLLIDKTPEGQIKSADLLVGAADAQVQGLNVMVRTENGDQVRLHMGLSEDGTYLKEAFLQIPSGGEIKLQQDDLKVRLGGGQKLGFEQDGQGRYTFKGEGLDVHAVTKDAEVTVKGGNAQISLDSQSGNLIIEDITGVNVNAKVAGQNIDINIKEMDGFLVKATGISGLATGAAIHLVPTGEGSTLTAEIRTSYNGIPIAVKLDNVHELKAMGSIQTNRAHVYFGDPSGRGQVELSAGPLKMQGSAIEWVAQYHSYDPVRMMNSLSRALSSDGYEIVKGVQVELDGVLRLQTPFKTGPHAGLTLLFPRPAMGNDPHQLYHPQQFYGQAPGDGATGAIVELGWKHTNRSGTQFTEALHAGLVPGSYLNIQQTQGETTLGGIKLPTRDINLPTTAIAGVTFRRHGDADKVSRGDDSRLDVMVGGFVNPAGLVNSPYIKEDNAYGAYGGFEWRKNSMSFGFSTTVGLSGEKPTVGGQVRFGINF